MQKKDDKGGNKLLIKKKGKGKKRAREKDRNRFATKKNVRLVRKNTFFAKPIFSHSSPTQPKTSPKNRNW